MVTLVLLGIGVVAGTILVVLALVLDWVERGQPDPTIPTEED